MRHQTVESPSSLPSLMMPCPICAGRMAFHARHPVTAEVEDTVYACRNCGAELIRTSVRQGGAGADPDQERRSGLTRHHSPPDGGYAALMISPALLSTMTGVSNQAISGALP